MSVRHKASLSKKEPEVDILIVDDEPVLIDSLTIGLQMKGYHIVQAFSGQHALDLLDDNDINVDMVLTDYMMPNLNGLDVLLAVQGKRPLLPVIIMTGFAETRLVIEALKNHCAGFIEKPFTLDQLVTEIERVKNAYSTDHKAQDIDQLLPRLVHQINNPLAVISGAAQLMLRSRCNAETLQKDVKNILVAARQINRINKKILNIGRIKEDTFRSLELIDLICGCLDMFQGLFVEKEIQVEKNIVVNGKLCVLGDRFSLEQVFNNLILNAIEALENQSGKILRLTIRPSLKAALVDIVIEDTGCGIRPEKLRKIFEPYYTDKPNGNGLGLEIIKNIVSKHGGWVLVESLTGTGSSFTVRLPVIAVEAARTSDLVTDEALPKMSETSAHE